MNSKRWLKIWFTFIIIAIFSVGLINYIVDPLWTFGHKNSFNEKQLHFNERQQKSNYVYFNGLDKFDGVMFGSSRTTFVNQNDFIDMNIYNYAVNSMYPFEYNGYLQLAKEAKGKDLKYVIIGADFYNTMHRRIKRFEDPAHYIDNTKSFLYRYKMLFSFDALKKSLKNIKTNIKSNNMYYLRNNIKVRHKVSEKERLERYVKNIIRHTNSFNKSNYKWNNDYFELLRKLKRENTNTKFFIFTSPITADLFVSVLKNTSKLNEYQIWIKELVDIFGEIYCFMDINSITTNLQNYPDDDHYYPYIGKILANKVSLNKFDSDPLDFGMVVNRFNVDSFLEQQLIKIKNYKYSKYYPEKDMAKKLNEIIE